MPGRSTISPVKAHRGGNITEINELQKLNFIPTLCFCYRKLDKTHLYGFAISIEILYPKTLWLAIAKSNDLNGLQVSNGNTA